MTGGAAPRRSRLRIHFTADDLARVRVANGPDPMWESVLSMHLLQTQRGARVFSGWRKESRARLGQSAARLMALNPAVGSFPDFLTPASGTTDLEAGVDAMLSVPSRQVWAELSALPCEPSMRTWMRTVAEADLDAMKELGQLFRAYFATVISPTWSAVVAEVEADRRRTAQAFLDGGPVAVLTSVSPDSRWRSPVLEIGYPVDRDLHLDGRGILLIPSYFCWRDVVTLVDPALPPVLVHPVRNSFTASGRPARHAGDDSELSALLGFTRATVLRALETPCTTTALGRRAGTSVTSASQHTAVLRRSGLITTSRHGGAVVHTLTGLGADLLRASGA
jgi:hypothetical protein